ncbi:MAG: addiction module protein [Parafilimonas sp.]|nr:addiction module protein [Parafilimonas sp.]
MAYDKKQLLSLPADEKLELAEELWSSVEENLMPITSEELAFAEERLKLHEANPNEGMSIEQLKKYFADKYGF